MKKTEYLEIFDGDSSFSNWRKDVLNWLGTMQVDPTQFRMGDNMDATIFSSCFALFIMDLFGVTESWGETTRSEWIDYINSFQEESSGFFIPAGYHGDLNSKPVHQLTSFCLSALELLGYTSPKYELKFVEQWQSPENMEGYLREKGCLVGRSTSGNAAMFVAIFLTYLYEKSGEERYLDLINTWFRLHNKHQNPQTGFWGNAEKSKPYLGFQNGLHQFVIYNYWNKPIKFHNKIVDNVMKLQAPDGFFSPYPGGSSCADFDAADILIHSGFKKNYRIKDVKKALLHLAKSILASQNKDGGFCETRKRPASPLKLFSPAVLRFIFSTPNFYVVISKLKSSLSVSLKRNSIIDTHWTKIGRRWDQSNLWDTWFRCLTVAEIACLFSPENGAERQFNFLSTIGLGWYGNETIVC